MTNNISVAALIIVPAILLLLVTPFKISLRGLFNSIRKYMTANLSLLGVILAFKLRIKLENGVFYYTLNGGEVKRLGEGNKKNKHNKDKDSKKKGVSINPVRLMRGLYFPEFRITLSYGSEGDAMKTALGSAAIKNALTALGKAIGITNFSVDVVPDYERGALAADLDISVRFAAVEIFIMALGILSDRRKQWKTSKA